MFQMMGVFAEFERAMIIERVRSGMARARERDTKSGKAIGRPWIPAPVRAKIHATYQAGGVSLRQLAKQFGVGRETVRRLLCGGD